MILNQVRNIIIGNHPVQSVYLGTTLIWQQRMHQFLLDITRFSAQTPVLYSTTGAPIAEVSAQYGDLEQKVYAAQNGLHVTGDTRAAFPAMLPASGTWTIRYKIRDHAQVNTDYVHHLFQSTGANLELAYVTNWDQNALHFRLTASRNGTYMLYPGVRISAYDGFYDDAIPLADLQYYQPEYCWINDGQNLTFYVSGFKRASISIENLPDIANLFFALDQNSHANIDDFIVTHLEIKAIAEPPNYILYRWRLTAFHSWDQYAQIKRFCLYDAAGNRLDTHAMACAFACYENGACVTFPNNQETCRCLISTQNGKACMTRSGNQAIDIFISIPGNTPLASYSYITGDDMPERDPISWSLSRSTDGGQTWTEIDQQTNYSAPSARSTETDLFFLQN